MATVDDAVVLVAGGAEHGSAAHVPVADFAIEEMRVGKTRLQAIVEAGHKRARPIVMTTMCFIHMAPPYFATGAGAEMRRSVGTAMLWGAFGVTLFGIFLTPVFYSVVRWFSDREPILVHNSEAEPAATTLAADADEMHGNS